MRQINFKVKRRRVRHLYDGQCDIRGQISRTNRKHICRKKGYMDASGREKISNHL
jgi:hypothetical protein